MVVGEREHIDDAATHGILPRLDNKVHPLKAVLLQHIHHKVHVHLGPLDDSERVTGQRAARHHLLCQCFGEGDHQHGAARVELLHHLAALHHIGIVGGKKVAAVVLHGYGLVGVLRV